MDTWGSAISRHSQQQQQRQRRAAHGRRTLLQDEGLTLPFLITDVGQLLGGARQHALLNLRSEHGVGRGCRRAQRLVSERAAERRGRRGGCLPARGCLPASRPPCSPALSYPVPPHLSDCEQLKRPKEKRPLPGSRV